jgi:hypothetical protein
MITILIAAAAVETNGASVASSHYLPWQGLDLLVVLLALFGLVCAGALIGVLVYRLVSKTRSGSAPVQLPGAGIADPQVVAAVTTAVGKVLAEPFRIVEIRAADLASDPAAGPSAAWTIEGRVQHFSSHKVR